MDGGFESFMKTPKRARVGNGAAPVLAKLGDSVLRSVGLVLMVVGCFLFGPTVLFALGFLLPAQQVEATLVERYYLAEARQDVVDADAGIRPSLNGFRSTIVLEYADAKGRTHRVAFFDRSPVSHIGGLLDAQVPLDRLEIRFSEGLMHALKQTPAENTHGDGERDPTWNRSAYDSLRERIENPAEFVARSWTAPTGTTVPLLISSLPLAPPTLARSDRWGGVGAAIPLFALGLGFAIAGLRLALGYSGTRRAGRESRTSGNSRWWLILVLTSPVWVFAAPFTLGYFGVPGARFLVETVQRSPYGPMEMFGSPPLGEPAQSLPIDSITFPSPTSVYAPLWETLKLQRPERCCETRQEAITAASASVRETLLVMSAEQRAAVFDAWSALQMDDHSGFDPILEPVADQLQALR